MAWFMIRRKVSSAWLAPPGAVRLYSSNQRWTRMRSIRSSGRSPKAGSSWVLSEPRTLFRVAGLYRSKHADFHGPATKVAKVGVLPRALMALSPDFFVTSISKHSRRTSATVFSAAGPSVTRFARPSTLH